MNSNEKASLLGNDAEVIKDKDKIVAEPHFKYVHLILLPVIILCFCSYATDFYMVQQWIQHSVKKDMNIPSDKKLNKGCNYVNESSEYKLLEKRTADWSMVNSLATTVPSFFGAAILPAYSDSYGRKFLFLIGCSSNAIRTILHGLSVFYSLDLIWVVMFTALDGLTGSMYTFLSATMSYAADITSSGNRRTFGITLVDGCVMVCVTAGGLLSGLIIEYKGYTFLASINALFAFIAWVITITALPETHNVKNRTEASSIRKTFKRMVDIYVSKTFKKRRLAYTLLISSFFFVELTNTHRSAIEIVYQLGQPFCWSADQIGMFTAARHATQGVAGIAFIAPLRKCLSETAIAIFSAIFNAGSFILEALASTDMEMFLVPLLSTFAFLTIPMIKSMLSTMTPVNKQGSVFASIVAVQCLCGIVADLLLNQVYSATVSFFSGFVFLLNAGFCVLVFILLLVFLKSQKVIPTGPSKEHTVNTP